MSPEQFQQVLVDLELGKKRMDALEQLISENRDAHIANATTLQRNTELMEEIRDIIVMGKAFFNIAGYIGKFLKWSAGIAAALGTFWAIFHNGAPK